MKQSTILGIVCVIVIVLVSGTYVLLTRNTSPTASSTQSCVLRDGIWVTGDIHCTPDQTKVEYTTPEKKRTVQLQTITNRIVPKQTLTLSVDRMDSTSSGSCTLQWYGAYAFNLLDDGSLTIIPYEWCTHAYVGFFRVTESTATELSVIELGTQSTIAHFEPRAIEPIEYLVQTLSSEKKVLTESHVRLDTNNYQFDIISQQIITK